MSIKFLNQNIITNTVRPTGFKFPVGLNGGAGGPTSIDYVVVAGGGGGGRRWDENLRGGGGGGAGGFRTSTDSSALSLTAQAYAVTVGAGGAGGNTGNP